MQPYPPHWPQPDPNRPKSLVSRVTEEQKHALYNRIITTRALAKTLGVHEQYLSYRFPGKVPLPNKKLLIEARKEYKLEIAKLVLKGVYTVRAAAKVAHVSYNTMSRYVTKARLAQRTQLHV